MKTPTTLFISVLIAIPAIAQHADDAPHRSFRWYVGPVAQVSQINGEIGLSEGFQAGWIVNDRFTLGFEANLLETDIRANRPGPEGSPHVYLWYGGLTAEYGLQATSRLRLAGRAVVGGGEAHWRETSDVWHFGNREKDEDHTTSLIFEPGVYAAYGLNGWVQAVIGASYRYAGGGKSHAIDQADLRSFTGTVGLRLGRF